MSSGGLSPAYYAAALAGASMPQNHNLRLQSTMLPSSGEVLAYPSAQALPPRYSSRTGVVLAPSTSSQLSSVSVEPRHASNYTQQVPPQLPPGASIPQLARGRALSAITAQKASSKNVNIAVGVRARPLSDAELVNGEQEAWAFDESRGLLWEQRVTAAAGGSTSARSSSSQQQKEHAFDHVFSPSARTDSVYHSMAAPLVSSALEGINSTLLCYGQTGAGKTFSLLGTRDEPGITVLAIHDLFRRMEADGIDSGVEYLVRFSYLELYMEEIRDLLNPQPLPSSADGGAGANAGLLRIVDDAVQGPYVRGLTEEVVLSPQRALELLAIGESNRRVASTAMNASSSRSHSIVRLVIESRRKEAVDGTGRLDSSVAALIGRHSGSGSSSNTNGNSLVRVSSLTFIDLAGSERVSKTNSTGVQLKESGMINASLLTLGLVINKLVASTAAHGGGGGAGDAHSSQYPHHLQHVPYRDSKLTRLLSTSLGGNALTAILVTISPSHLSLGESRSSLAFAERAMRVVNRARVNEVADEAALIAHYKSEIAQLKAALLEGRGGMIITADGDVVTAEAMLERMKRAHEESQRSLEVQLREHEESAQEATSQLSDLLQLCFVAAHACGHLRSSPLVMETLAEVAAGTMSASMAVRRLVTSVPGFQRRMTRLLRNQHIKALSDTDLEAEFFSGTGWEDEVEHAQQEQPEEQNGEATYTAGSVAGAAAVAGLAASSVEWSASGEVATAVRQQAASPARASRSLSRSGASAPTSRSASPTNRRGGTSRTLTSAPSSPPHNHTGRTNPLSSPFASPQFSQLDLLTSPAAELNDSRVSRASGGNEPHSQRLNAALTAVGGVSSPATILSIDYFSPASFAKQLEALMAEKDALVQTVERQEASLASLKRQHDESEDRGAELGRSLSLLQAQYDELELENARLVDEAAASFLVTKSQTEELEALRRTSAENEQLARVATLELNSLRQQHEALLSRGKEVTATLEEQLQAELVLRKRLEVEVMDHAPVVKALEHRRELAERERDAAVADLQDERKRADDLSSRNRTLYADNEAQALLITKLESQLSAATASLELLRAQVEDSEAHLQATLALEKASSNDVIEDLRMQLKEATTDTEALDRALKETTARRDELAELTSQLSNEAKLLRGDLQAVRTEKQTEVAALQQQLNAANAAHRYALRKEQDECRSLRSELETFKDQLTASELELQGEIQRADDAENALADLRARLLAVDKDKEGVTAKLFAAEAQVKQLERLKSSLEAKIKAATADAEAAGTQLSSILAAMTGSVASSSNAMSSSFASVDTPSNGSKGSNGDGPSASSLRRTSTIGRRMTLLGLNAAPGSSKNGALEAVNEEAASAAAVPPPSYEAAAITLRQLLDAVSAELARFKSASTTTQAEALALQSRLSKSEEEKRDSEGKLEALRRLLQSLIGHAAATIPEFAETRSATAAPAQAADGPASTSGDLRAASKKRVTMSLAPDSYNDDEEEEQDDGSPRKQQDDRSRTLDQTPRKSVAFFASSSSSSAASMPAPPAWKAYQYELELASVFEALRTMHSRLRQSENEVAGLRKTLSTRENELEALLKEQQRSDNSFAEEARVARERYDALHGQFTQAENLLQELQLTNERHERTLAAIRGELSLQIEENGALKDQLVKTRREVNAAREEAATHQADLSFALNELDDLKERHAQLRREGQVLREQLVAAQHESDRQLAMAFEAGVSVVRKELGPE